MNGILLFNKPLLWTSHDAVDFVRRRIGQKKVGHAGSLDPLATGLLLILIGHATKLTQAFSAMDKDYWGSACLGLTTDTQDLEGRIVGRGDFASVTPGGAEQLIVSMRGEQNQVPPAFSALRKNGQKLYALARRGVRVEAEPRRIAVSEFRMIRFSAPEIIFFLSCSKGTYVRTICDELGKKLGCGATLSALVRSRIGPFYLKDAWTAAQLKVSPLAAIESALLKNEKNADENLLRT